MPKIFTNSTKGLTQKSGSGMDIDELEDGFRLKHNDNGAAITLTAKSATLAVADDATTATTTGGFIPAKALVVACSVEVATASVGGNDVNITDLGLDGDPDYFNPGNATLDINTADGVHVGCPDGSAAPIHPFFAAADEVVVTFGDVGTQTTDASLKVTLFYYDLSAATAASNN